MKRTHRAHIGLIGLFVLVGLLVLVGQPAVFDATAAAQSDACRVGQELGPGDYCTVDIPGVSVGTNRFEVGSDGLGCYGGLCSGRSLNLGGFRASRIGSTSRWRIDAVPGGGGTNRSPRPSGSIPAQTLTVGGSAVSVNVARYFTDPDGDTLTYTARSSRTAVVTASVSGGTVTLAAVAAGTATVTVTARDPDGETATQSVAVTVQRSGGEGGACRVGQELGPGDYCTVDIPGVDVGTNRFEVRSDGLGCYGSICSGRSLNLGGFRASRTGGTSRWRIDAVPGGGGTNRPPRPTGSIPAQTLTVGGSAAAVNVARYFTDPDGDALTYTARSSRPGVARASVSGGTVALTPVAVGTATVTVTARDPDGETATQSIAVTVAASGGAAFTDDPLVPGGTPVRAVHFQELRTRTDALRARAGLPAFAWTDRVLTPGVTPVRRVHLTELRVALNAAYAAVGRPAPVYADARVTPGTTPIRAGHITELRSAVIALEALPANRAPRPSGSIPAQTLAADATRVDVAPYFSDPDGDPLGFTAVSSRIGVVTVAIVGSIVTLTPVDSGTATVTVTARDPDGLSATQRIAVRVQRSGGGNGACRVGQELGPGDYCTVDIPGVNVGTDRFEVRADGRGCYGGHCSGGSLNLGGFRASRIGGTSRWRIDAVPGGGGGTNRPPRPTGSIPAQTLTAGGSAVSVNVARYFTDPDGDALTYTARSSRTGVVRASVSGGAVRLTPVATGTATVTVTARDPDGETATQAIAVTVEAEGPGGSPIEGEITGCSGSFVARPLASVTMEGTVRALRSVTAVVVTGTVNGTTLGADVLGSIEAGSSRNFSIAGTVSVSGTRITCRATVDYVEVSRGAETDGMTGAAAFDGAIR